MASGRDRERLLTVIHRTARETLQAHEVFLVLDGVPQGDLTQSKGLDGLLREIAGCITTEGRTVLWPASASPSGPGLPSHSLQNRLRSILSIGAARQGAGMAPATPDPRLSRLLGRLCAEARTASGHKLQTVVAVPFLIGTGNPDEAPLGQRKLGGVLLAVGRRDGRAFTTRDAILLETLADQVSLSLENLKYYEVLRGRVELANRDLRDAYQVMVEQSAKLAAAVENIDNALIITDENGHAIFVNPASAHILLHAVPALGEPVPEKLRTSGLAELAALFDEVKMRDDYGPDHRAHCETTFVVPVDIGQETTRCLAAQVVPLIDGDGRFLGAMLVVADVTTQRELDKMKTDFVSFVAHELRSPLTSILGYASLLQETTKQIASPFAGEATEAIVRQCNRLNRMIAELLDVSRLEAGRPLELRCGTVDLVALCQHVLDNQRAALSSARPLSLQLRAAQPSLLIRADADRLEQVVTNLVSNAIKYSPDGGEVTVTVEENATDSSPAAVLRVQDTGMGMSPEQVSQLFQKFYRTPDAQARGIKGTGLGLYLVKRLVEAHDGQIEVESAVGQGTTFTVTLPQTSSQSPDEYVLPGRNGKAAVEKTPSPALPLGKGKGE
ncbi:MAG: ATP-binding protein, partial [Armatimonadota bacterium]|nr:ATP-binding protein [Armatimonadota bacterium]